VFLYPRRRHSSFTTVFTSEAVPHSDFLMFLLCLETSLRMTVKEVIHPLQNFGPLVYSSRGACHISRNVFIQFNVSLYFSRKERKRENIN
jgi:hypothetical protein